MAGLDCRNRGCNTKNGGGIDEGGCAQVSTNLLVSHVEDGVRR
jgi:hypothetical protein